MSIVKHDLEKAKLELHEKRRAVRREKFLPVDGDSMYASLSAEGEALRSDIKAKDDASQKAIDDAVAISELKAIKAVL